VAFEVARGGADFHQLAGQCFVRAGFLGHNAGFKLGIGIVELESGKALLGGLLQILHQVLIAWIVGNHQLEIGMRLEEFALLVQGQGATVVSQRVDHHRGVLARFDDFVQIADRADACGNGQRAIQPACAAGIEQVASNQVGGGHVFVAGHGNQRLV
jgi:hypothetical protein